MSDIMIVRLRKMSKKRRAALEQTIIALFRRAEFTAVKDKKTDPKPLLKGDFKL